MVTVKAHAKINLSLDVLGVLPDGYHEVEMVMQSLELHDTVEISRAGECISVSVDGEGVPGGSDNLAYKAAQLLQDYTGINDPVHIHIKKKIPVAAGLAGGSADAAAVLVGLQRLWNPGLEWDELIDIGSKLGADVPYCMTGKTMLARGKGEKLTTLPFMPSVPVVLVKPAVSVSTGEVYKLFDRLTYRPGPYTGAVMNALREGDIKRIASVLGNALEPVTVSIHPRIKDIKEKLLEGGALGAEMSGSGPTVFGITGGIEEARRLAGLFSGSDLEVLVTYTGAYSPCLQ